MTGSTVTGASGTAEEATVAGSAGALIGDSGAGWSGVSGSGAGVLV